MTSVLAGCALVASGCGNGSSAQGEEPTETPSVSVPFVTSQPGPTHTAPNPVPKPGADCLEPSDHARRVRFGPKDALGGYVLGSGHRYVVLSHQSGGDSCQMLPLARRLSHAGFRVVAFDFNGTMSSRMLSVGDTSHTLADDLLAAVRYARHHGARSLALVGCSMGGFVTLDAATRLHRPADAVISLSAPSSWDDPAWKPRELRALGSTVQLYAGRKDVTFTTAARKLAKAAPNAELHIVKGAGHGVELVPALFPRLVRFLDSGT
ncbi:MAG: alpha/beta hydrolase [Nocardioidaceae bacterium]